MQPKRQNCNAVAAGERFDMWLVRIEAPHMTAGVVVGNRRIIKAAPVLAWSVGRLGRELVQWARDRGYAVEWQHVEPAEKSKAIG